MQNDHQPTNKQPKPDQVPSAAGPTGGERVIQPLSSDLKMPQIASPKPTVPAASQAPAQVASPATTNPSSAFPPDGHFLTGSQLPPEKKSLPVGIYIIVGLLFVGFILGFFNTNTNPIYMVLLFVNLGLGLGLLLKNETVRKILVILSSILIVLSALSIIGLYSLKQRVEASKARAETALNAVANNPSATPEQLNAVNNFRTTIANNEKTLDKTYSLAYIEHAVVIAANLALVIYLMRPKVRDVFI